ncbi:DUF3626 domain-containing protein [Chitinophaga skermanii]|nr:DUF3626 domain-containing protein [Chitinophaga skermanii]
MIEKLLQQTDTYIAHHSAAANANLKSILHFSNISEQEHVIFHELVRDKAAINIHFHPDRLTTQQTSIINNLLTSGEYKNQYATNTSAGSLTAKVGGDRYTWENQLFQDIYGTNLNDRPKYGSLHLTGSADGASPRFGACYFVTKPGLKERCTFTYGDSYLLPKELGTANNLAMIYAKLYEDIFTRNTALGLTYESIQDFMQRTTAALSSNMIAEPRTHNLDFYIETQIHGPVDLKEDVTALVADASFKSTPYEATFHAIAEQYNLAFSWHPGYALKAADVPGNFRGIATQTFARKIAHNGIINAYVIGQALTNAQIVADYESLELLQLAKYTWHCLVKFGTPVHACT